MKGNGSSNNQIKSKKRAILFIIAVLFIDLLFLYVSKYNRKNLSITEFNPDSIGNILNFIFFIIPFIGLVIIYFKNSIAEKKYTYILLVTAIFLTLPLILTVIIKEMRIIISIAYMWGYPVERIFIASLFAVYQSLEIFLGFYVWFVIFKVRINFITRSFIYTFVIIFLLVAVSFFYNNDGKNLDEIYNSGEKSDVAVILGAAVWSKSKPSPLFASRINKANNLYNAGIAKKLQVTGGNAPGELSEALVAYRSLIKLGVDSSDIWIEEKTATTSEQIAFIKDRLVKEKNLKNILIISDQFHLKRVIEICKFYNLEAEGVASDLQLSWANSIIYRFKDSIALLVFWLFAI